MNIEFGGGFLIVLVATLWILVAHFWWQKFGGETNFFGGGMYLISCSNDAMDVFVDSLLNVGG